MTPSDPIIRVKFLGRVASERVPDVWLRQLPGGNPLYRGCEFIFDMDDPHYDWLVIYDDLPAKKGERFSTRQIDLSCPRARTMLVTMEPSSIKLYGRAFLDQFGVIVSSQDPKIIRHPGHIQTQSGLRWYYGLGRTHLLSYDEIEANPPLNKTADLSTVCSNKRQKHTLHHLRYEFTQELKMRMPELDIFGHGVRDMDDKAEALVPYRYHVVIENHHGPHHWTEKLSDCFLACCLPFYFGAPNVADYFPKESVIPIDIRDLDGAEKIIRHAIADRAWDKRLPFVLEARRRAMEDFSLFAQVARLIRQHHRQPCPSLTGVLLSRRAARKANPFASIPDMVHMGLCKISAKFRPTA